MTRDLGNPQNRVEAILENMLGASNELQPPQTRVEELLMEILEQGGGGGEKAVKWIGVTTTPLSDGATTNPIQVDGKSITAVRGDMASYDHEEFIYDGEVWQALGNVSGLGLLAFKDSASSTVDDYVTDASSTFTGDALTSTGTFTPDGTISDVVLSTDSVNSMTNAGALPTAELVDDVLVFHAGTLPTYTSVTVADGVNTQPTFTGTSGNVSVTGTPSGSVDTTLTKSEKTITVE